MNLTATICTLVLPVVVAQQGPQRGATNIAVVNLAEVFTRFQMTADLEQKFEERRQVVAAEGQTKRDAIHQQRGALIDLKPDSPDFKQRRDDLIRLEVEFKGWLEIQELRLKEQHKDKSPHHYTKDDVE